MKIIKWKSLIITCLVCLVPIIFGIALWDRLPENVAIHFDVHNTPDGFASKGFAVFGIPLLMVLLQIICCVINDVNAMKHGTRKELERATKWIIPAMTVILQAVTFVYALGYDADIRKIVAVIVGAVLIIIGNYIPKLGYVKNMDVDTGKARKINRFIGFETVIMGLLFVISIFLPPVSTVICLFLLIPYAIVGAVYGIAVAKK